MIPIIKTKIGKVFKLNCKNCKHSLIVSNKQVCILFKYKENFVDTNACRSDENICGEKAKHFQESSFRSLK